MIKRELYINKIKPLINKDIIKVITGIRRCGKSYMLYQIVNELKKQNVNETNIFLISFESTKYNQIKTDKQLDMLISELTKNITGKIYLLFDEIQLVKDWERSINAYRIDYDCDIYITGSNSSLLSGELATLIAGRYMEIKIYPFSYKEVLKYKKENNEPLNEKEVFNEYINYGSMPFVLELRKQQKMDYLQDVYNSILLKDIIKRNNIRDIDLLDRLIHYMSDNIGHTFSARSISKFFKHENIKVSSNTINNYLYYCTEAYLLLKVERNDLVGKKILKISEKYYLMDHGFNQALVGFNRNKIGQILENIVYIELLRRGYKVYVGKIKDLEVDFICLKYDKRIYVQVTYILTDENTINREFKPLLEIDDNYPKYVLSLDEFDFSDKGITHMNIIEFLKSDI